MTVLRSKPVALRVAAVSGELDWSFRQTCSGERFDVRRARAYVRSYTARALARLETAAGAGAKIVVGPEYFRGSEMFLTTDANRRKLGERAGGATARRLGEISARFRATLCCAYDLEQTTPAGEVRVEQTGMLTGPGGELLAAQLKHPRRVPAPADWPFNTAPRVYSAGGVGVGITVCSDCTYDPWLPLLLARHGMDVLLLPGCGFVGEHWRSFVVVRARDTQCPVVYADDRRAAIADAEGNIVAETDQAGVILYADVVLPVRRSSPDEAV